MVNTEVMSDTVLIDTYCREEDPYRRAVLLEEYRRRGWLDARTRTTAKYRRALDRMYEEVPA